MIDELVRIWQARPMSPGDRQARRRERTRASLVAAAREVMAAKGLEATTIQDVTDAADVGKGSFYNHFDSKDAIAQAVVEEITTDFVAVLDRLCDGLRDDPARVTAVSIRHFLRKACEDPVLGRFVLRSPDAVAVLGRIMGPLPRRNIGMGIESGRFRCESPELMATILGGALTAVLRGRLVGVLGEEADADFALFALRGLGIPETEARAISREPLPPLT